MRIYLIKTFNPTMVEIGKLQVLRLPTIQFTHKTQWMVMIVIEIIYSHGLAMVRWKSVEN